MSTLLNPQVNNLKKLHLLTVMYSVFQILCIHGVPIWQLIYMSKIKEKYNLLD